MKNANHAAVLFYNVSSSKSAKLKVACIKMGIRVKDVAPEQFTLPLGYILGLAEYADAAPTDEAPFQNEMLVFYQLSGPQLDRLLPEIRKAGGVRLKAVVTPTNISWNACALSRELMAEREAIAKSQKAHEPQA